MNISLNSLISLISTLSLSELHEAQRAIFAKKNEFIINELESLQVQIKSLKLQEKMLQKEFRRNEYNSF